MRVCLKLLLHYVALFEIHSVSSIPKVVQLWPCYFSDPLDIHCCFILEGMMSAQCDNVLAPHVVLLFPAHRFSNMNTYGFFHSYDLHFLLLCDQRFGLHDDSSKKMPSMPLSTASCVRQESQLQLPKTSSNPVHRWNPSLPDSRCKPSRSLRCIWHNFQIATWLWSGNLKKFNQEHRCEMIVVF